MREMSDEAAQGRHPDGSAQQGGGAGQDGSAPEGSKTPEAAPARRRRTVRRRGGYTPGGPVATAMASPPPSMTVCEPPATPVPEAQDGGMSDQEADG
jgi:hypothetical protein